MKAGWIGQIAGVAWGAPTEFRYQQRIIPSKEVPSWKPEMINNAFKQDDLYVEMTFLKTLEEHGFDVSLRRAAIDFANSEYKLYHANLVGRKNLRRGIAPPDSGHPAFNQHADDIDYQIEADYSGLIAPGMPEVVIGLGDKFGRLMNYGDGVYGGQFVGGMYAEAFFERDIVKIIKAGLACIPGDSQYAEMVNDLLRWYHENPDDWETTWRKIEEKYQKNRHYRQCACLNGTYNIDAKINGAYILVGLLYGKGDPDRTVVLSMRCGQDSDCNPSSAAGILFTSFGFSNLPARFTEKLDEETKFEFTAYNVPGLIAVCEKLARQAVVKEGGRIGKNDDGEEIFIIPVKKPSPGPYLASWNPAPPTGQRFTEEEYKQIRVHDRTVEVVVEKEYPYLEVSDCGPEMNPGVRKQCYGRENVVVTHPPSSRKPCILTRREMVPTDRPMSFKFSVAADGSENGPGQWKLVVKVNNQTVLQKTVRKGWSDEVIDLTPFAGKRAKIQMFQYADGDHPAAAYWQGMLID